MRLLLSALSMTCLSSAALAQSPTTPPPASAPPAAQESRPLPPLAVFQKRFLARIMEADTDHDGRVSHTEWAAWRAGKPSRGGDPDRTFKRMDTNGDGYLTPDEINAASAVAYQRRERRSGEP